MKDNEKGPTGGRVCVANTELTVMIGEHPVYAMWLNKRNANGEIHRLVFSVSIYVAALFSHRALLTRADDSGDGRVVLDAVKLWAHESP